MFIEFLCIYRTKLFCQPEMLSCTCAFDYNFNSHLSVNFLSLYQTKLLHENDQYKTELNSKYDYECIRNNWKGHHLFPFGWGGVKKGSSL